MEQAENITKTHAVQLFKLAVRELFVHSNIPPDSNIEIVPNEKWAALLTAGCSKLDENNVSQISLTWQLGDSKPDCDFPVHIKVEIIGFFRIVDTARFNPNDIEKFAKINAPSILLPYIRAEVFNLSARAGFKPFLIPLLEASSFKF